MCVRYLFSCEFVMHFLPPNTCPFQHYTRIALLSERLSPAYETLTNAVHDKCLEFAYK